ncbi:hypothetical protein [Streptomyces sp. NPDC012825]|uniref:hypothetical protein n=1 Tax=Streptomyces sp. NPDC012825 TaxID=3364851 RepID=UPI0036D07EFA
MPTTAAPPLTEAGTAGAIPRGGRVLLAPVTITPTKPLTPSHLKFLLWTDVMFRATAQLTDCAYRYSHTTYHLTEQTLGFWAYLDRTRGDCDYTDLTEKQIGELYVAYRSDDRRTDAVELRAYADAVEHQGWVHPVSVRVLRSWTAHFARIGLHDPGLLAHQPPGLSLDEALEQLRALDVLLDMRGHGGPVYLDHTRHGLPLRQIVGRDGRPNYLACAMRELLPMALEHDEVVLLHDPELGPDYHLLERTLTALGARARRFAIGRVPIDGTVRSARHGGWQGYDAGSLLDAVGADHAPDVVRLGLRLYFIAVLGPGADQSFRHDLLRQCMHRADRLLSGTGRPAEESPPAFLARHHRGHLFVHPYRLTSALLARHRPPPPAALLSEVYL